MPFFSLFDVNQLSQLFPVGPTIKQGPLDPQSRCLWADQMLTAVSLLNALDLNGYCHQVAMFTSGWQSFQIGTITIAGTGIQTPIFKKRC